MISSRRETRRHLWIVSTIMIARSARGVRDKQCTHVDRAVVREGAVGGA